MRLGLVEDQPQHLIGGLRHLPEALDRVKILKSEPGNSPGPQLYAMQFLLSGTDHEKVRAQRG